MINLPETRNLTDEFLQDNGIDLPTSTTVVDDGENSIVIHEDNSNTLTSSINTIELNDDEINRLFTENADAMQQALDEAVYQPTVPVNKIKHIDDETRERFSSATWANAIQDSTIILAGLGGIGSNTLYCLSKMNPRQIFIYDDDSVEMVNLAGQMYSKDMIGLKKVDAMSTLAINFSDYHGVQAIPQKFTKDTPASDIMICGFDNMEAREVFFQAWRNHVSNSKHPENCLFIDGRLEAERFQVFCLTGDDEYYIKKYTQERLFSSDVAEPTVCSYKQTAYCANMIGSVITNLFTNFIANTLHPDMPRSLPYFTYYDALVMYFKTEG